MTVIFSACSTASSLPCTDKPAASAAGSIGVYEMAFSTASLAGMLGIPPRASVDKLAAAAAKVPM